jgi:hypothetical protein
VPHGFDEEAHAFETLVQSLDLAQACLEVDEPSFNGYTRLELVYFVVVHTQRIPISYKNCTGSW